MAKILTDKWHLYPPPPSRPSLKNADLLNKSLSLKNCNLSLKIGEKSLKYFCLKLYEVKAEKAVLVWCGKSVKFGRVDVHGAPSESDSLQSRNLVQLGSAQEKYGVWIRP